MAVRPPRTSTTMFARTLAFGALALLMTVPASQAASLEAPAACAMPYQAAPYNGPLAQAQTTLDNLAACTYHTHDAPAPLPVRILFVPYIPLPELFADEPATEPGAPVKESWCLTLVAEPTGEPRAQPIQFTCRVFPAEPGPEPQSYDPRADAEPRATLPEAASIDQAVLALVPFYGQFEDAQSGNLFEPQPLPGRVKSPSFCKADFECRAVTEPSMMSEETPLVPAEVFETLGYPLVCAQVYPYSLVCSAPNGAVELVLFLLKA